VDQALQSMTLDSAYLAFEEDLKGTLVKGKPGDNVVLGADPHKVAASEIKDIPMTMTIVSGEVAYGTG
jgi:predicted amidohydrolase YtcJ